MTVMPVINSRIICMHLLVFKFLDLWDIFLGLKLLMAWRVCFLASISMLLMWLMNVVFGLQAYWISNGRKSQACPGYWMLLDWRWALLSSHGPIDLSHHHTPRLVLCCPHTLPFHVGSTGITYERCMPCSSIYQRDTRLWDYPPELQWA